MLDVRKSLAEFFGTFILVFVGAGAVALASLTEVPYQLFVIAATFAGVLAFVILTIGGISGAHINPAVTLALGVSRKLKRELIAPYLFSQFFGGLAAGYVLLIIFPSGSGSQHLGSTSLASGVHPWTGFTLEIIGTFILVFVILSISRKNLPLRYQATIIGSTLFLLIVIFGPLTGAALNPARSIGPALASGFLENLSIYILGPVTGGVLASIVHKRSLDREKGSERVVDSRESEELP